jgi:hypothetical protein
MKKIYVGNTTRLQIKKLNTNHYPLLTFSLLFLFLSCNTMPKTLNINLETTDTLPFESGAFAYVFADAKKAHSIIDILPIEELKDKQIKQMLDKTRFFAAALYAPTDRRRYQIAAQGNYPRSNAELAMSLNKGWEKRRSAGGGDYWFSNGTSVLLTSSHAYAAMSQNGDAIDPFTPKPGVQIPEQFNEFRHGSPLSCWIVNPLALLNRMLAGLPVQSVKGFYFKLLPAPEKKHEVIIRLQFENPSHARGLATILSFAGGSLSNSSLSFLLANPPIVDGKSVDIKSNPLSEKEIKSLLELLL